MKDNFKENGYIVRTKILCSFNPILTDSCHGVVDWQQHKWQEVVYHAKDNCRWCIYDIDAGKSETCENGVDYTIFGKQKFPCQDTEHKVHPHRKHKDKNNQSLIFDFHII